MALDFLARLRTVKVVWVAIQCLQSLSISKFMSATGPIFSLTAGGIAEPPNIDYLSVSNAFKVVLDCPGRPRPVKVVL